MSDASPSSLPSHFAPSSQFGREASSAASTLVAFPILNEDIEVVMRNLAAAAGHPAVRSVIAIIGDHENTNRAIRAQVVGLEPKVRVLPQQRIGTLRPGKGDAINTAFKVFLEDPGFQRVHFYDADIKTFDGDWITKAEAALDDGFQAVRHFYPRAATDAMITWMVTRLGFAALWPASPLPDLEQPLSGELAFHREAAATLSADPRVRAQSDWGVDTVISFATLAHGLSIYESYIARGKDHALYSSLADLKVMMVECLGALQRLRAHDETATFESPRREREPSDSASEQITQQIGFDIEATQHLLAADWTTRQEALLTAHFPEYISEPASRWKRWPDTSWMDEEMWFTTLAILLDRFVQDDDDWRDLAFRLWVGRVLHYTLRIAVRGHAFANDYLHGMVARAVSRGLAVD